jgi:hypothetical protein
MIVALAVAVAAPMMVAALVGGNDIVNMIDAVRRSGVDELRWHIGRHRRRLRARSRALITATASFPLTSAATITGAATSTATAMFAATGIERRSKPEDQGLVLARFRVLAVRSPSPLQAAPTCA